MERTGGDGGFLDLVFLTRQRGLSAFSSLEKVGVVAQMQFKVAAALEEVGEGEEVPVLASQPQGFCSWLEAAAAAAEGEEV